MGGGGVTGQRLSNHKSQHAQSLNNMLDKSCDIVGEREVDGGRDEYSTAVGGRNVDTSGVTGAT